MRQKLKLERFFLLCFYVLFRYLRARQRFYPKWAAVIGSTRVVSSLSRKYSTRLKKVGRDQHSSLFMQSIGDDEKMFYGSETSRESAEMAASFQTQNPQTSLTRGQKFSFSYNPAPIELLFAKTSILHYLTFLVLGPRPIYGNILLSNIRLGCKCCRSIIKNSSLPFYN